MMKEELMNIFNELYEDYGQQNWWPGEGLEIAIGAVLTQQTNWNNVERALQKLREEDCLNLDCLQKINLERLEELVRPSGYYRVKAKRLKNLVELLKINPFPDRETLLSVKGLGNETVDSILLYLFKKLFFVIDAYTFRIFNRIGLYSGKKYLELQQIFMDNLPNDLQLYQEYHALLVKHAKVCCTKNNPQCETCVIKDNCLFNLERNK